MGTQSIYQLTSAIRRFFLEREFIEIDVPPVVENPGMETHIHPFEVVSKKDGKHRGYLHTSPEFYMKKVLASGLENIFTLSFSHRDEPISPIHSPQFLMLEWYRKDKTYLDILDDTKELIQFCYSEFDRGEIAFQTITVSELFKKYLGFDILDYLNFTKLENYIRQNFSDIPLSDSMERWAWDDLFFILFLNKIEPELEKMGAVIVIDYPAPLAALSTIKKDDPRVCERFEVYIDGIEIANCFNEITDLEELKLRFERQNQEKKSLYSYQLPEPKQFYETMKAYPPSAGIALGVGRLNKTINETHQVTENYS